MKVNFFKREDFDWRNIPDLQFKEQRDDGSIVRTDEVLAKAANAKLEREGFRVYGTPSSNNLWVKTEAGEVQEPYSGNSHQALLINIEELPKKPCEHEPSTIGFAGHACKHCGVKLKAKWEVAE